MKRIAIITIILTAALTAAHSQVTAVTDAEIARMGALETDTISPDSLSDYDTTLDSLIHDFFICNAFNSECTDTGRTVFCPDSVYIARLQALPYEMEMPFNHEVKAFIEMYLRKRRQVSYMVGLGRSFYFQMFEQALSKYNVPMELCNLPVIESALNARAVSSAGAAGLWQFMVATGRLYGLEVNSLVDERMDPLKSTDAAARYLRDLYRIYGDWHLVIAAYNCGPGNVVKAMRRSGKSTYWGIYPYLPKETRGYVPIFIAANYVMHYYKEHNICPARSVYKYAVDTIMIKDRVHLRQIADVVQIPYEELEFLNPQYRKEIIPGNIKPYPLILPLAYINAYDINRDSILAYRPELSRRMELVSPSGASSNGSRGYQAGAKGNCTYYKVRQGDNLGAIAKRHHVSVKNLQNWNGLRGTFIRAGQTLKIYH